MRLFCALKERKHRDESLCFTTSRPFFALFCTLFYIFSTARKRGRESVCCLMWASLWQTHTKTHTNAHTWSQKAFSTAWRRATAAWKYLISYSGERGASRSVQTAGALWCSSDLWWSFSRSEQMNDYAPQTSILFGSQFDLESFRRIPPVSNCA